MKVLCSNPEQEPLLSAETDRLVLFPIQKPRIWEGAGKMMRNKWLPDEIHPEDDLQHWKTALKECERQLVKGVLAFFGRVDGDVGDLVMMALIMLIRSPELRKMYYMQVYQELIHWETYQMFLNVLVPDPEERASLLASTEDEARYPSVVRKSQWIKEKLLDPTLTLGQKIACLLAMEGVGFTGGFGPIYWLKKRGLMPALVAANDWIAADEGSHADGHCTVLTDEIKVKPTQAWMESIFREMAMLEDGFYSEIYVQGVNEITPRVMRDHIKYIADFWLKKAGYAPVFAVPDSPFAWWSMIKYEVKQDFFTRRVTQYQDAGVLKSSGGSLGQSPGKSSSEGGSPPNQNGFDLMNEDDI